MIYYSADVRHSKKRFPTQNLCVDGMFLYAMEQTVDCMLLDDLDDIRRYRWYYCGSTAKYWRFDYKEEVFDKVLNPDHIAIYIYKGEPYENRNT